MRKLLTPHSLLSSTHTLHTAWAMDLSVLLQRWRSQRIAKYRSCELQDTLARIFSGCGTPYLLNDFISRAALILLLVLSAARSVESANNIILHCRIDIHSHTLYGCVSLIIIYTYITELTSRDSVSFFYVVCCTTDYPIHVASCGEGPYDSYYSHEWIIHSFMAPAFLSSIYLTRYIQRLLMRAYLFLTHAPTHHASYILYALHCEWLIVRRIALYTAALLGIS